MAHYLSFLPDGDKYPALKMFVAFLLRDPFAWDLRLYLAPEQAVGMQLGNKTSTCIGRTTFLGAPKTPPYVTLRVRK